MRASTWRDWLRARPLLGDTLLALGLFLLQLAALGAVPADQLPFGPAVAVALTAVEMTFVAIRRRWLWPAVFGTAALSVGMIWFGFGATVLGFVVVAYTAAAYLPLRPALLATGALWVPTLASNTLRPGEAAVDSQVPEWFLFAFNVMVALVCFFVGRLVRTRRAYVKALEERASTAEANQRTLAAQAVAEERRRIARELHDMVAHHVAVMSVLATGARRTATREPQAANQALVTIEETGRTVLREMRRLLHVLRSDAEPAGELAPQPGLAGIEALIEQVREAGLRVNLQVEGDPGPLDPGVALAVYRIVQEALTNVLKHAGPATAQVRIGQDGTSLVIEVFDTGRGPVPHAGRGVGHGLVSMRERLAVYGGTLRAGPRPGGGFRVYAKIPADQLAGPETGPQLVPRLETETDGATMNEPGATMSELEPR